MDSTITFLTESDITKRDLKVYKKDSEILKMLLSFINYRIEEDKMSDSIKVEITKNHLTMSKSLSWEDILEQVFKKI